MRLFLQISSFSLNLRKLLEKMNIRHYITAKLKNRDRAMKRFAILTGLLTVIFTAASFAAFHGSFIPAEINNAKQIQIFEAENQNLLDADNAAIHDLYFSQGASALRALNQKRIQQYFTVQLLFAVLPLLAPAEEPEMTFASRNLYSQPFSYSKIVFTEVIPARAGPRCV